MNRRSKILRTPEQLTADVCDSIDLAAAALAQDNWKAAIDRMKDATETIDELIRAEAIGKAERN